jgi:hypothetical protein
MFYVTMIIALVIIILLPTKKRRYIEEWNYFMEDIEPLYLYKKKKITYLISDVSITAMCFLAFVFALLIPKKKY